MLLIIIGFIILLVGQGLRKSEENVRRRSGIVRLVGFALMIIGILTSCIIQIDAGTIGVKKLFGKVQNDVLGSGLHFINPVLEVERMDIKTQNYTMSGINDEGIKSGDGAIRVLTADGLEVSIDL